LGSLVTENGKCNMDINRRTGFACAMAGTFGKLWR